MAKTDYGHWKGKRFDPAEHFGFVYNITNTTNGRIYIGQKQLHRIEKKKPLKGRKNKRHFKKDSDWRKYTGSSNELNADIERLGKECFQFKIMELHESKWEMSYCEYSMIIKKGAVLKESYYNLFLGRIGCPPKRLIK